jgi:hypothetical protein
MDFIGINILGIRDGVERCTVTNENWNR